MTESATSRTLYHVAETIQIQPFQIQPSVVQRAPLFLIVLWFGFFSVGVAAQASSDSSFARIAEEGQSFSVQGEKRIRFGAGSSWIEKAVSGSATCTNAFFGQDPVVGVKKWCEASLGGSSKKPTIDTQINVVKGSSSGGSRLADEGQPFSVRNNQLVRYGSGDQWIEQLVSGLGLCSNAFFAQDPAPNVKKRCELVAVPSGATKASGQSAAAVLPAPLVPSAPHPIPESRAIPPAASWGSPRDSARFFVSGHSLTDDPFGANVVHIARSLLGPVAADYNQQISIGSPIRARTGMPGNLAGYSIGKNRPYGEGLDIQKEFLTGGTIGGNRYDALVIAENHNLLEMLRWENTVKQIRHFHDQLVAGNPRAETFVYATWWNIDKSSPGAWLDAERAMGPVWQCATSRINQSLIGEGRKDRVWTLPASLALVDLVERALNGQIKGVSSDSSQATLDHIFFDNVHLTRLGTYYLSLITYAAIYQRSPEGAPAAQGVTREQAAVLQPMAWAFVSNFYVRYKDPPMTECNTRWMPPACERYWTERKRPSNIPGCKTLFQAANPNNPFYYDAASDARFWFPAKP